MKIKHLKEWLSQLPPELDEVNIVFRKILPHNNNGWMVTDKTIAACGFDAGSNEAYLCDETSYQITQT